MNWEEKPRFLLIDDKIVYIKNTNEIIEKNIIDTIYKVSQIHI